MKMYDTGSDNESMDEVLSGVHESAANDANYLVPEKSRKVYDKIYQDFMNWKISNNKQSFKEEVLLEYFHEMSDKFKFSTLSTNFSILKNTLSLNHEVDISKYSKVIALIKRKALGYTGKKSKTFSPEEINKFLKEANDDEYLAAKVALIFGIVGACRRQELYRLQFEDVEVLGSRILVKIYNSKAKTNRVFTITGDYYELCKKYISLRPDPCCSTSFFIHYKSGKYTAMSVGINQFGNLSKTIAKFLKLPNPELYTGHCFRRTSATILVDADGDILPLRGHVRYKTTTMPEQESCINDSMDSSVGNKSVQNRNAPSTLMSETCLDKFSSNENRNEQIPPISESYSNKSTSIENRNEPSMIIPEACSNNFMESNIQEPNQFMNSFENQNIEHVNIHIPKMTEECMDNSMESKDEVWSQIKNSFFKNKSDGNLNTPGTSLSEDYLYDSMEDKDEAMDPVQNPLEVNTDKVVNINLPASSSNLQQMLSTLVRFDNCNIQNVNIYYNK